jgi:beta-phosphoglucomutase
MKVEAVIFDLDGTLIDNNPYHLKAWKQYLLNMGREVSEDEYKANFNGRTNKDVVEYIYQRKMTDKEAAPYYLDKERMYREIYQPYIAPVSGLLPFLEELHRHNIPMAIATSGIMPNINFTFEHIPIKQYFKEVIYSAHIRKGKPDPEIYERTAEALKVNPGNCVVFEDALVGIQAAKGAGMKVVAVTTTHTAEELYEADKVIKDYTEVNLAILKSL